MDLYFSVAFVVSLVFSGIVGTALITWVVRSWQLIRSEREGAPLLEALDRLDRIEARLDMMVARLDPPEEPEQRLTSGSEQDGE